MADASPVTPALPPADSGARRRATLIGLTAIGLWSSLAALTVGVGPVPPLQLTAFCFLIGGAAGLAAIASRGASLARAFAQPPAIWALGVGGLFGYHALYFAALQLAPPAEAALVNYLWPLLIVLLSSLLPGGRLGALHLIGALAGFAGAAILLLGGDGFGGDPANARGYAAAFGCALIWSGYSVLSRLAGSAPTESVAGFCLATAALSAALHLAFEPTIWPADARGWLCMTALGLGPVGAAFYAWDHGVKRGDIQLLGVAAYAAPLLSTLSLVAIGAAEPAGRLWLATGLIAAGGLVAAFGSRSSRNVS